MFLVYLFKKKASPCSERRDLFCRLPLFGLCFASCVWVLGTCCGFGYLFGLVCGLFLRSFWVLFIHME